MISMSMIGLNDNVESNHSELTYIYHLQTGRSLKERERQQPSVYNCCGRQRKKVQIPLTSTCVYFPLVIQRHMLSEALARGCVRQLLANT